MATGSITQGVTGVTADPGTAPHLIAGATFRFSPNVPATLTLSGSQITAAADVGTSGLSLAKSGTGPTLTKGAKNGYASARFTHAGLEKMLCTGTGTTCGSDIDLTMICAATILDTSGAPYSIVMAAGSPTPTLTKTIWLGCTSQTGTQWFAGAQASPSGAIGGTADQNIHVFSLEYSASAGKFTFRLDGQIVAGPTAATIASSATFTPGIGFFPQGAPYGTSADVLDATWFVGTLLATAARQSVERYYARAYGVVK